MLSYLDHLTLYKITDPSYRKLRLGSRYDGGYVIIAHPALKYRALLSYGVGNDYSFESSFYQHFKCQMALYDPYTSTIPTGIPDCRFFRQGASDVTSDTFGRITDHLASNRWNQSGELFLKMDIEGAEFKSLRVCPDSVLQQFKQIVIELHVPKPVDLDILQRLQKSHYLCHYHGNNCSQPLIQNNKHHHRVFELTLLRKDQVDPKHVVVDQTTMFPTNVDGPNVRNKPHYPLGKFPFWVKPPPPPPVPKPAPVVVVKPKPKPPVVKAKPKPKPLAVKTKPKPKPPKPKAKPKPVVKAKPKK